MYLHEADGPCGEHKPLEVESGEHDVDALVGGAQHVGLGDAAVLEDELARARPPDAKLVQLGASREAGHALQGFLGHCDPQLHISVMIIITYQRACLLHLQGDHSPRYLPLT